MESSPHKLTENIGPLFLCNSSQKCIKFRYSCNYLHFSSWWKRWTSLYNYQIFHNVFPYHYFSKMSQVCLSCISPFWVYKNEPLFQNEVLWSIKPISSSSLESTVFYRHSRRPFISATSLLHPVENGTIECSLIEPTTLTLYDDYSVIQSKFYSHCYMEDLYEHQGLLLPHYQRFICMNALKAPTAHISLVILGWLSVGKQFQTSLSRQPLYSISCRIPREKPSYRNYDSTLIWITLLMDISPLTK